MKNLITISLLFLILNCKAQQQDSIVPFYGIPFGSSQEFVIKEMSKKGYTIGKLESDQRKDSVTLYYFSVNGKKCNTLNNIIKFENDYYAVLFFNFIKNEFISATLLYEDTSLSYVNRDSSKIKVVFQEKEQNLNKKYFTGEHTGYRYNELYSSWNFINGNKITLYLNSINSIILSFSEGDSADYARFTKLKSASQNQIANAVPVNKTPIELKLDSMAIKAGFSPVYTNGKITWVTDSTANRLTREQSVSNYEEPKGKLHGIITYTLPNNFKYKSIIDVAEDYRKGINREYDSEHRADIGSTVYVFPELITKNSEVVYSATVNALGEFSIELIPGVYEINIISLNSGKNYKDKIEVFSYKETNVSHNF